MKKISYISKNSKMAFVCHHLGDLGVMYMLHLHCGSEKKTGLLLHFQTAAQNMIQYQ